MKPDASHIYTNASLRKLLGESGFIEDKMTIPVTLGVISIWRRGKDVIRMIEYKDQAAPILTENKLPFNQIDPSTLGVRNPNVQQPEN